MARHHRERRVERKRQRIAEYLGVGDIPKLSAIMVPNTLESILEKQLAMNRQTWAALQKHAVTTDTKLCLDFFYNATSRAAAEKLRALLQEQTDYEVQVESRGSFLRRKWRVEGRTQETAISPEILDQWVTWMVTAGDEQSCDFDGWGTSVPEKSL